MESLVSMLVERNLFWYGYLKRFFDSIGVTPPPFPNIGVFTRRPGKKGWVLGYFQASEHIVAYNYWFIQSQDFKEVDNTVCHEMCHCFQRRLFAHSGRPWGEYCMHGELFYFLFCTICKNNPKTALDGQPADKLLAAAKNVKIPAWLYKTVNGVDTVGLFHEIQDLNIRSEQAGYASLRPREAGRLLHESGEVGQGGDSIDE